jgi:hypothetical protein
MQTGLARADVHVKQMPNRVTCELCSVAKALQPNTQEAKLLAPVTEIIDSVHCVPTSFMKPSKVAPQNG